MIKSFLIAAMVLCFSTAANAQKSPDEFLIALMEQARELPTDNNSCTEDLLTLVRNNFDIEIMGRFILGRYWRKATYKQQEEFLDIFEKSTTKRFAPMLKDIPPDSFNITKIESQVNDILIYSTFQSNNNTVKIKWRLRRNVHHQDVVDYPKWPEYKIIDIVAGGISLALTLRAEYNTIIAYQGIEGLISELQKKLEKNDS